MRLLVVLIVLSGEGSTAVLPCPLPVSLNRVAIICTTVDRAANVGLGIYLIFSDISLTFWDTLRSSDFQQRSTLLNPLYVDL